MDDREIKTGIDRFLELVNSGRELRITDAARTLGVPETTIELWADILSQDGMVEINYDGFGKMVVKPLKQEKQHTESSDAKKQKPSGQASIEKNAKEGLKKRILSIKKDKGKNLLKKYSKMRRETEIKENRGIVSKVLRLFKGSFNRRQEPVKNTDNKDTNDLRKRIEELKKMSKK